MQIRALLPGSKGLVCESIDREGNVVIVVVNSSAEVAECPRCGVTSDRVHSRYTRRLADLPWQGLRVELRWRSRRFFCKQAACTQLIFTERLPDLAGPYKRKTNRLLLITRAIAVACGGEQGSALAARLGIRVSPDTMLREVRRASIDSSAKVRVLGVDDWSLRRGQRYGTILVDLERHRVIDLLPERSSEAFGAWLREHPEVEIVSRDRGDYYIKGAESGAPAAQQVADRFHLVRNLQEALLRVVERSSRELKAVLNERQAELARATTLPGDAQDEPIVPVNVPTNSQRLQDDRRARRMQRYAQVIKLREQKVSRREIGRRLGLHRSTVRKWLEAGCFPERDVRHYARRVGPWTDYLVQRWAAGCRNAAQLTAELRAQGFDGSYYMVCRIVRKWRTRDPSTAIGKRLSLAVRYSAKSLTWLLFKRPGDREPQEQRVAETLCNNCSAVSQAVAIAQEFRALVHRRHKDGLAAWLNAAQAPDAPIEMQRFAAGIKADQPAVELALSSKWSNGQTEGQVNRLKLIKRQMYGRASFDLLRTRVLAREL